MFVTLAVEDSVKTSLFKKAFMVAEENRAPHCISCPLIDFTDRHYVVDLFPHHEHLPNSRPCVLLEVFIASI